MKAKTDLQRILVMLAKASEEFSVVTTFVETEVHYEIDHVMVFDNEGEFVKFGRVYR